MAQAWCQRSLQICLLSAGWQEHEISSGCSAAGRPAHSAALQVSCCSRYRLPCAPTPRVCRPLVPRVTPCKQTRARPETDKGSLKSGGKKNKKHQTYWLGIICLHKHTHKHTLDTFITWKNSTGSWDPMDYLELDLSWPAVHTEKLCSRIISRWTLRY